MLPLRIGYRKGFGVAVLLVGAAAIALGLALSLFILLGLGAAAVMVGALYLFRPFLEIGDGEIRVKSLMGWTARRFRFDTLADLEVTPRGIAMGHGEQRRHLILPLLFVSRA